MLERFKGLVALMGKATQPVRALRGDVWDRCEKDQHYVSLNRLEYYCGLGMVSCPYSEQADESLRIQVNGRNGPEEYRTTLYCNKMYRKGKA